MVTGLRAYLAGNLAARTGDWIDLVALNWAALALTQSAWGLAIINACRLVPAFALSVPAGVLADRHDRRALLVALSLGLAAASLALGWAFLAGAPFWAVAGLVALRACLAAAEPVVRGALLAELVEASELTRAVAQNSTVITTARLLGPAVAAPLLAVAEPAAAFALNAVLTAVALATLRACVPLRTPEPRGSQGVGADLAEAWAFIRGDRQVQGLLALAVAPMVLGFPYTAMLPLFAQALHGFGASGFASLLGASAVGALAASTWLARRPPADEWRWLVGSSLAFGAALDAFMLLPGTVAAHLALAAVGAAGQLYRTLSRATLQGAVPDRLRGRILSIALMDRGFIPAGAMLVGAVASWASPLAAGLTMGTGCMAATLLVARRARPPGAWVEAVVPEAAQRARYSSAGRP